MQDRGLPEPGRAAGLSRLARFLPNAGSNYTRTRNFDFGPERRGNTSVLAPFVRHRLVLEPEILEHTLQRHPLPAASKFVDEVFWRAYFKGFLEHHPAIWGSYTRDVSDLLRTLQDDSSQLERYNSATEGKTGIECFDDWARELVQTGYLHNHARMWFASIWIYTLQLPWQLGADFFLRHLMDGDPASNTLSWRWVCGLHTPGKTYLARASNIANFTDRKYDPAGQLATSAPPLSESRVFPCEALPPAATIADNEEFGLLVTEEDCSPEIGLVNRPPSAVLGLVAPRSRSPLPVGFAAYNFAIGAVKDGVERVARAFEVNAQVSEVDYDASILLDWASDNRINTIATAYVPVGPTADLLRATADKLEHNGVRLVQLRRAYDDASWPHATRGYFKLKKAIPSVLQDLGIGTFSSRFSSKVS